VSSKHENVQIPAGIDEDGKVVLNISYGATKNLELINEGILFDGRFSGVSQSLYIPIESILAIYARENGQGMMFGENEDDLPEPEPPQNKKPLKPIPNVGKNKKSGNKSFLKVVK
jgi:stringent starvation protein B